MKPLQLHAIKCDANNYLKLNGMQLMIRVINHTYQQKMVAKLGDNEL